MKKKTIIILSSVVALFALGVVGSYVVDWPLDQSDASGDIAKSARFSRKEAVEKLTNMEELLQNDSAFKDGIVAAQVVMQTRALQFGALVEMSNEAAGDIPAFAEVLKDMNAAIEMVNNVSKSLLESGQNLNAALEGKECPDLAQNAINASLAYTTLQKQNKLADQFIEVTDKYLEKAQGDDRLKFVRDRWLEYQQMTAALDGDEATAEALAKKDNLLKGQKVIDALALFGPISRAAMLEADATLVPMGAPSELSEMIGVEQIYEIVSMARQSATVEQKASGQDLNNNPEVQFANQITKQLENVTSFRNQSGLKHQSGLENQGTLEMSKRGNIIMSFPDLANMPAVVRNYTEISQHQIVSQKATGDLGAKANLANKADLGAKANLANKADLGVKVNLAHQTGLAIHEMSMGNKPSLDLKTNLANKADLGAKASIGAKASVGQKASTAQ